MTVLSGLDAFRSTVRDWCRSNVPAGWREAQTGVGDDVFLAFQQQWFQTLRGAGYAVPHWPAEWGGGMSTAEQVVLYQELAAADAPRLVIPFVSIHHAASTLLHAGTEEQRQRHLPAILDGEIWVQGFSEPGAGSDLASLKASARREGDSFVVNGQKVWASGAMHADFCLLLARSDADAPKRKGISYFIMDMRSPGVDVRPIRNAVGEAHFCEIFLDDVVIPEANLIGPENQGWQVAQATLAAERGMTMLELSERLGHSGFRWLVELCSVPGTDGRRPVDDSGVRDRLASLETEVVGLRALCASLVDNHEAGAVGPADASIVKLYYSELLQRLTDFGAEVSGLAGQTVLRKPLSSGWESGAWVLDFIGSWEWTIPGGASEIQRTIIGERGLDLPQGTGGGMTNNYGSELGEDLRDVVRNLVAKASSGDAVVDVGRRALAEAGLTGLEVPENLGGAGVSFTETVVVAEELAEGVARTGFLGGLLAVGCLDLLTATPTRDALLEGIAAGETQASVVLTRSAELAGPQPPPFVLATDSGRPTLSGSAAFAPDAAASDTLLLLADEEGTPVVVAVSTELLRIEEIEAVDETRCLATVSATGVPVRPERVWTFAGDAHAAVARLHDRAAIALAADSIGVCAAALATTVEYVRLREQFARPIGSFQAVKHSCADMLVTTTVARELLAVALRAYVSGSSDTSVAASMAKAYADDAAVSVAGTAMQLHGGIGYAWESGIHRYLKRATLNRALLGSPRAHRARIAEIRDYGGVAFEA